PGTSGRRSGRIHSRRRFFRRRCSRANALAAKWGGRVVNDHVNLDGETACLVQAQPTKPALQPVEGLVAIHAGNLYLMTGGVTLGHSCDAEFETIRQSWRWIPIGAPEKEGHKP